MGDNTSELKKRIAYLEKEINDLKQKEEEMDDVVKQYNELIQQEFLSFETFVEDLVDRKIIDENTRVYSKNFFDKFFSIYFQKAFESNNECGIVIIKIPHLKKLKLNEEKKIVERQLGKIIRESVRIPLDYIFRYSKDTFVILLTDVFEDIFEKIKNRISDRIEMLTDYSATSEIKSFYIPRDKISTEDIYKILEEK
ncbi:MAG: diguanylate cyclase domain-containing protein [Thermotogota bacterium]